MPKPRRGAGFAQEAFPRFPAPCNASVDHFQRHGVTQDRIEGTVGYSHRATAQFVKTAVVAPHNLVMIKTVLVEQVLHRRFGLHRPAQQAHRATLIVFLGRVRDAAVRAAVWPLALGALKDCFWYHAMPPSSFLCPHPPFGLHKGLTESVQLGLYLCRVQHGALNFLAHQLRVALA